MQHAFDGATSKVKRVAVDFSKPMLLRTGPYGAASLPVHANLIVCEIFKTFLFLEELKFVNDGAYGNCEKSGELSGKSEVRFIRYKMRSGVDLLTGDRCM